MKNDGGPAFPLALLKETKADTKKFLEWLGVATLDEMPGTNGDHGMSLRDYFAGQAVPAVLAFCKPQSNKLAVAKMMAAVTATDSYLLADAMLAEREKS